MGHWVMISAACYTLRYAPLILKVLDSERAASICAAEAAERKRVAAIEAQAARQRAIEAQAARQREIAAQWDAAFAEISLIRGW